ncbi:hypothetical protein [Pseudomonas sp. Marseille-QA0892]
MTDKERTPRTPDGTQATRSVDQAGEPVEAVRRHIEEDGEKESSGVDKVITPTANREKEQTTEKIEKAAAEAERKLKQ